MYMVSRHSMMPPITTPIATPIATANRTPATSITMNCISNQCTVLISNEFALEFSEIEQNIGLNCKFIVKIG